MWNWLALVGTPLVSLAVLATGFASVSPSCAHQSTAWLHALHGAGVLVGLGLSVGAWRARGRNLGRGADAQARRDFVNAMALPVGLLFTLVMLAEWFTAWVLSPCAT